MLGSALARVGDAAARLGDVRLLLTGGDTSSAAARALGIEAVEMVSATAPGAPLCRAHAPGRAVDGAEILFKGGGIGAAGFFTDVHCAR